MPEAIVAVALLALVGLAISTFARDLFSLDFSAQSQLGAELDARHVAKNIIAALREAEPSATGGYPIVTASSSTFTFFADPNNDGTPDEVTYYMSGTSLMQGVTPPTGSPATYNSVNEKIYTVVHNVTNGASTTQPLFQYYNTYYAGTSSPLSQPVNVQQVRLVKITITIDSDSKKSPNPITVTSQAAVRNLKDNL